MAHQLADIGGVSLLYNRNEGATEGGLLRPAPLSSHLRLQSCVAEEHCRVHTPAVRTKVMFMLIELSHSSAFVMIEDAGH